MDEKIMKLQELIDGHDNIVFFGGAGVFDREPGFRISVLRMDFIIRNMTFRRRLS